MLCVDYVAVHSRYIGALEQVNFEVLVVKVSMLKINILATGIAKNISDLVYNSEISIFHTTV